MDTRIGKETTLFLQSLGLALLSSPSANTVIMPTSFPLSRMVFIVTVGFAYIFEQRGWEWADPIPTTTKKLWVFPFLSLFHRFTDRTSAVGGREGTKTVSEKKCRH
jgi:hypothetical protein